MSKFISIGKAAELLGVSRSTLRRWEKEKKLIPQRTEGSQRRYLVSQLYPHQKRNFEKERRTIAYARVSSYEQKRDLERQKEILSLYCSANGWQYEVIDDLGSGMNYNKKGLKKLINDILEENISRLVLTHKDRLLRFGAELIFAICELKQVEIVIINQGDETSFEEELAKDVLEIITVFSARLYGSRSRKNQKLIAGLKEAYDAAST